MRQINDKHNWRIEQTYRIENTDKVTAREVEGNYIRQLRPPLNTNIAGREKTQYRIDN